jgi:hypothetical protein
VAIIRGAQGFRIRLKNGFARTKKCTTSVPTKPPHSTTGAIPVSSPGVGNDGGDSKARPGAPRIRGSITEPYRNGTSELAVTQWGRTVEDELEGLNPAVLVSISSFAILKLRKWGRESLGKSASR